MSSPLFSVIIPTCNRPDLLSLCLDKLAPGIQALDPATYEVIVSDDGSDEKTKLLIESKYDWVLWVNGPKKGPAANRNNGVKFSKGNWLVFTDDDCVSAAQWLWEYAEAIQQNPKIEAFEGAILPDNRELLKSDMSECPVNTIGGCFWTANVMIRKDFFLSIGGFDEAFKIAANEDQEIYLRIRKSTVTAFVEKAIVIHPVKRINLYRKISMLPQSERSQILLRQRQQYDVFSNWLDGVAIHARAGFGSIRKLHFKRLLYNITGFVYRAFAGPFIIYKVHRLDPNIDYRD